MPLEFPVMKESLKSNLFLAHFCRALLGTLDMTNEYNCLIKVSLHVTVA